MEMNPAVRSHLNLIFKESLNCVQNECKDASVHDFYLAAKSAHSVVHKASFHFVPSLDPSLPRVDDAKYPTQTISFTVAHTCACTHRSSAKSKLEPRLGAAAAGRKVGGKFTSTSTLLLDKAEDIR